MENPKEATIQERAAAGWISKEARGLALLKELTPARLPKDCGSCMAVRDSGLYLQLSRILQQSWKLDEVLKPLTECLGRTLGFTSVEVRVAEVGGNLLESLYRAGEGEGNRGSADGADDLRQWVKKSGKPAATLWAAGENVTKTLSCVPVKMEGGVVGTISTERILQQQGKGGVEYDDLAVLTKVAALLERGVEYRLFSYRVAGDLYRDNDVLRRHIQNHFRPLGMVGDSSPMKRLYVQMMQASRGSFPVLLEGEKGTGKNCVARALHAGGSCNEGPLVEVDCAKYCVINSMCEAGVPGMGLEAYALKAHGGTLFFDHIEKLSPSDQKQLLELIAASDADINDGPGAENDEVRVVCATSQCLPALVDQGKFSAKLYRAIAKFAIRLPSLRERRGDILQLADYFAHRCGARHHKKIIRISVAASDFLLAYDWPGNVGEMYEAIEQAVLACGDGVIRANHFPNRFYRAMTPQGDKAGLLENAMAALEYELVVDALQHQHGNIRGAARQLGTTERIMGCRVKKYRLDVRRFEGISLHQPAA